MKNEIITITTEFIRLDATFKARRRVGYRAGRPNSSLQNGEVEVNGEVCTMRGKKCVTATMPNITAAAIR